MLRVWFLQYINFDGISPGCFHFEVNVQLANVYENFIKLLQKKKKLINWLATNLSCTVAGGSSVTSSVSV